MPLVVAPESHCDHVRESIIACIIDRWAERSNPSRSIIIETIELPEGQELPCSLYGPAMGDNPVDDSETFYGIRGERHHRSRMIDRPARQTRLLTVIAGPHGTNDLVLYTCYGGPAAPREPFDPALPDSQREESESFWRVHALASR